MENFGEFFRNVKERILTMIIIIRKPQNGTLETTR